MKHTYTLWLGLLLYSGWLPAQTMIKGKVADATTREPMIGVTVALTDHSAGTVTDENGNYLLKISGPKPDSIQIRFSYLGYIPQLTAPGDKASHHPDVVNIDLLPDAQLLQAVTITAFRKMQVEQLIPMSTTTIPALQLRRSTAHQFRDYANGVSNLAFNPQGAGLYGRFDNGISIRGIQGKNTTAIYLDETPLPPNLDPRLVNVRQVEVLKGPQGTLYGSRNMGGAVKIITEPCEPSALHGFMETSFAKVKEGDNNYSIEGSVNFPLGDKAALQWSGFHDFQTGVFDRKIVPGPKIVNLFPIIQSTLPDGTPFNIETDGCIGCSLKDLDNVDNQSNTGFSATLGFFPTKNIKILPAIYLQNTEGSGYDFADGKPGNFEQHRVAGGFERYEDAWKLYSLTAIAQTSIGKFVSSTSLFDRSVTEVDDYGETISRLYGLFDGADQNAFFAGDIYKVIDTKQFTQELRWESNFSGKINLTAGAFYTKSRENERWLSAMKGAASYISLFVYDDPEFAIRAANEQMPLYDYAGAYLSQETALFGEAWINISPKLKATIGLRLFDAALSIDLYEAGYIVGGEYHSVAGNTHESGLVPRFNVSYQMDAEKLFYANVSKGYRLGDVNGVVPDLFCSVETMLLPDGEHPRTYESDFLWNYELGMKSTWWGGRLVANAAIFYNDWENLQQNQTLDCGYSFISNIGSAHTLGMELEVRSKLLRGVELGGGLGYLNALIDRSGPELDAAPGDKILFTPTLTGNFYAQLTRYLSEKNTLYLRSDLQYVGKRLNTFSPEDPEQADYIFSAYTMVNARIGLMLPDVEFFFFGKNLTNTAANYGNIFPLATDFPGRTRYATSRPLTIGLGARLFF